MRRFEFRTEDDGEDDWQEVMGTGAKGAAEAAAALLDCRRVEFPLDREILVRGYGWWSVSAESVRVYSARPKPHACTPACGAGEGSGGG